MKRVYADHAATTAPAPEVLEAMLPWLGERFANASSVHARGEAGREAIETARLEVARLIGAQPEEIVFTATGSEANNLALKGVFAGITTPERRRIVVSAIEHNSVLETVVHIESRGGLLTVLPVQANGMVDPDDLSEALGPDVALVSIMAVNNETGVINPVADLGLRAKQAGALFHVDAVQAAGKIPIAVDAWQADLLTIAGHKFHGPVGAAALFVRRRVKLVSQIHGGHQERGRRAGTENVAAIAGLGVAAIRARVALSGGVPHRVGELGEKLLAGLLMGVPDTRLNGDLNQRVGGILNLCFKGVDGEAVLHELDLAGVDVSTGSACSAADPGPSHVLTAMSIPPEDAHASVRFSIGEGTTSEDIDAICKVTPPIVERLRALAGPAVEHSA